MGTSWPSPPRPCVTWPHRSEGWDVVHSYDSSLEGWLVLVVRRHITAVADLTDAEARELGPLIKGVSGALHDAVGCEKTYVAQFAEHPDHPHVHVHVIPRAPDLAETARGPGIFGHAFGGGEPVPEARRNEIAAVVRRHLTGGEPPAG